VTYFNSYYRNFMHADMLVAKIT